MGLTVRQRLRTVVATAVLTSAAWIAGLLVLFAQSEPAAPPASKQQLRPAIEESAQAGLVVPVQRVRREQLVDTWGQSRAAGARRHEGIDIMAPRGTPVLAAAAGTVEKLFVSKDGGNTIYVRSPDRRIIYYYAHLDRYAPGLAERQRVRAGQFIAHVGSTGSASPDGPHLHFAVNLARPTESWWQGTAINPYPLLRR